MSPRLIPLRSRYVDTCVFEETALMESATKTSLSPCCCKRWSHRSGGSSKSISILCCRSPGLATTHSLPLSILPTMSRRIGSWSTEAPSSKVSTPLVFQPQQHLTLPVILLNISDQLKSRLEWAASRKPLMYRCLNLLVSGLVSNDKVRPPAESVRWGLTIPEHLRSSRPA